MLEKISGIKELKEKIKKFEFEVNDKLEKQEDSLKLLHEEIKKLNQNISEVKGIKQDYVDKFSKDLCNIKDLQKEFEKALRTFNQNHNKLYDSIYVKLHRELDNQVRPIKNIVEQLTEIKPEVKNIVESLKEANQAVKKLYEITSSIKKEDFELKQYAKELLKMDTEKLRLMKDIETLKKVISSERRRKY
ncbi:MAG: hypothetical protein KKA65_03040 [Nanoarchaeota archaeon]|nr:hypothetical protein [Nanoarchaeota archaeon]MBU4242238.1 hypothetical protein [Nanoarchaeota archaeon]MBU4351818.1 hypothetical protein [Nanoarchaeota archaeon]MBU4456453.1 hypothetical protein [Nanoarchaeota archaeon]MCG2720377.1 hypothetical protein [Nanoarchaeota archaeon]